MPTLHIIGAGVPTPTKARFGTCCVLELDGEFLMFDCGPASTWKLVKAGLWPTRIEHLFFTHHHFDHNGDYPTFLLVRWDQSIGREKTLKVWGPPPMRLITERLTGPEGAFVFDWTARVNDPTSRHVFVNRGGTLPRPKPHVEVTDIGPGPIVRTPRWRVTAATSAHQQPWLKSLAYRVDAKGLSIVFAGDTEPCKPLAKLAKGCDVFVANCWDLQDAMDANGESPGQTGTRDAARMAKESGAETLVLTHMGRRISSRRGLRKARSDIAALYDGDVVVGRELMKLEL